MRKWLIRKYFREEEDFDWLMCQVAREEFLYWFVKKYFKGTLHISHNRPRKVPLKSILPGPICPQGSAYPQASVSDRTNGSNPENGSQP